MAAPHSKSDNAWLDRVSGRRIYIETYGCRYNFGDSAQLVEVLRHAGSTVVSSPEVAEVVVVNTCTVVGPTERRMLRRLAQFGDHTLLVTGCMPAVQAESIRKVCTPIFIDPASIREHYRQVNTVSGNEPGIVQVAEGCLGSCTYCITRFARGRLKSVPAPEIQRQVRAFVHAGTAEIQLTAQDVSAWGWDTGTDLPDLLRQVAGSVIRPSMIRVGMMNPATVLAILDDLIDAFMGERIFQFIHLPAQSGSDAVLARMERRYSVADYEEIVRAFRKKIPEITLMTDMIVGFPQETADEFSESLALIDRIRPNKVNVTRYSRRPLTPLAPEKDFPDAVKKDRSRQMQRRAERVYAEINRPLVGTVLPFVVTETIRPGSVMARSPNYTGIVINEDLPVGTEGSALLKTDRHYFFLGERTKITPLP